MREWEQLVQETQAPVHQSPMCTMLRTALWQPSWVSWKSCDMGTWEMGDSPWGDASHFALELYLSLGPIPFSFPKLHCRYTFSHQVPHWFLPWPSYLSPSLNLRPPLSVQPGQVIDHWALELTPHFAQPDNYWVMAGSCPRPGPTEVLWEDVLSVAGLPFQHGGCCGSQLILFCGGAPLWLLLDSWSNWLCGWEERSGFLFTLTVARLLMWSTHNILVLKL